MPKTKKSIGAMSRGKVRDELRRCRHAKEVISDKLRKTLTDLDWAENYIKLLESNGD